jgi:hypothetical protein
MDNRAPILFLLGFGFQRRKTEADQRQHNRGKEVFQREKSISIKTGEIECTLLDSASELEPLRLILVAFITSYR